MLNYWRTTAGDPATFLPANSRPTKTNTPIPLATPFSDNGFDGPFFDLEFALFNDETSESTETRSGSGNSLLEPDEEMREIELNLDVEDHDFKVSQFCKEATKLKKLAESKATDNNNNNNNNKVVRVKFEVDGVKGPLISLFARDISISQDSTTTPANLGKEMLQKYLNILKPLYVGVEKMKLHGGGSAVSPAKAGAHLQKVVRKHLGKSRSIPTAAVVSPSGSNRRDDSVQDGIQGAILYCKRSFNSDRGKDYTDL